MHYVGKVRIYPRFYHIFHLAGTSQHICSQAKPEEVWISDYQLIRICHQISPHLGRRSSESPLTSKGLPLRNQFHTLSCTYAKNSFRYTCRVGSISRNFPIASTGLFISATIFTVAPFVTSLHVLKDPRVISILEAVICHINMMPAVPMWISTVLYLYHHQKVK